MTIMTERVPKGLLFDCFGSRVYLATSVVDEESLELLGELNDTEKMFGKDHPKTQAARIEAKRATADYIRIADYLLEVKDNCQRCRVCYMFPKKFRSNGY